MARNRQRAKQRQAERRAERLERVRTDPPQQSNDDPVRQSNDDALREIEESNEEALEEVELYSGAPPEDTGRSDTVVEHEPPRPEFEGDDEDLEEPVDDSEALEPAGPTEAAPGPRGRRGGREHHEQRHHRNRVISFLIAVWAELQRVEWPDRQTLTMLTGVVLLFVIVMGAYLGLLDAIFSKLINKIL
ncbi:MAG TPA: preprotein translocase subunit SecE [Thermoleophilaceae bacterium]|jgi:preprotein translocase SecE subunit